MFALSAIKPMMLDLGFYHVAVAPIKIPNDVIKNYDEFIAHGYHGDMAWLGKNRAARKNPEHIFSAVKSILVLTHPYPFEEMPTEQPHHNPNGLVARYARGVDYHILIKEKLARVQEWLQGQKILSRAITDSAPFFEKPTAAMAGIGWQGKHSNLLSRDIGNWFFLAELFLSVAITDDSNDKNSASPAGSCGSCTACLDACPTAAFPAPYQLDARKCISYLTIEHRGLIDKKFRRPIGDMIFGCDLCLAACPFNKFAVSANGLKQDPSLQGAAKLNLADILTMGEEEFLNRFHASPINRLGLSRLQRNGLIVLANYFYDSDRQETIEAQKNFLPMVLSLLQHEDYVVRGTAIWCLRSIDKKVFENEKQNFLPNESHQEVIAEWQGA